MNRSIKTPKDCLWKLQEAGMTLKLEKCKFFQKLVKFLDFISSEERIKPRPGKFEIINNFPTHMKTKHIQSFRRMRSYYQSDILESKVRISTDFYEICHTSSHLLSCWPIAAFQYFFLEYTPGAVMSPTFQILTSQVFFSSAPKRPSFLSCWKSAWKLKIKNEKLVSQ